MAFTQRFLKTLETRAGAAPALPFCCAERQPEGSGSSRTLRCVTATQALGAQAADSAQLVAARVYETQGGAAGRTDGRAAGQRAVVTAASGPVCSAGLCPAPGYAVSGRNSPNANSSFSPPLAVLLERLPDEAVSSWHRQWLLVMCCLSTNWEQQHVK